MNIEKFVDAKKAELEDLNKEFDAVTKSFKVKIQTLKSQIEIYQSLQKFSKIKQTL